jgi:hypothetical protein
VNIILQIGEYQFGITTASYEQLQRAASWEWAEQPTYGARPELHYTGEAAETVTLQCTQILGWKSPLSNGRTQAAILRDMARLKQPYQLTASTGASLGKWVIVSVAETQSYILADGTPQMSTFDLSLKYYGE